MPSRPKGARPHRSPGLGPAGPRAAGEPPLSPSSPATRRAHPRAPDPVKSRSPVAWRGRKRGLGTGGILLAHVLARHFLKATRRGGISTTGVLPDWAFVPPRYGTGHKDGQDKGSWGGPGDAGGGLQMWHRGGGIWVAVGLRQPAWVFPPTPLGCSACPAL